MYRDFVIILISDQPILRKSTSRYSQYSNILILEYSTHDTSIDNIVKEFYTKFSKSSNMMIVMYGGIYSDRWAELVSDSSNIIPIYTNYHVSIPNSVLTLRPSYGTLCRTISLFCMYLSMDIFIHVGDTVGLLDQMNTLHYYTHKTMIKCQDEDTIDDIIPILKNTDKKVMMIINGAVLSKSSILSIIDSVDVHIYLLLFCNYSIPSVTKNVIQIHDPFSLDTVLEQCNSTRQYTCIDSYVNAPYYTLDVLQLNDGYLRDEIDDANDITTLHNSMYSRGRERDSSIARKYRLSYYYTTDRLVISEERLNYYNDTLHYSSDDSIGCTLYSTIRTGEVLSPSTVLKTDTPITVTSILTGVGKNNRY